MKGHRLAATWSVLTLTITLTACVGQAEPPAASLQPTASATQATGDPQAEALTEWFAAVCFIGDPTLDGPGTADGDTELIGQLDAEKVTGEYARATAKLYETQLVTLRSLEPPTSEAKSYGKELRTSIRAAKDSWESVARQPKDGPMGTLFVELAALASLDAIPSEPTGPAPLVDAYRQVDGCP